MSDDLADYHDPRNDHEVAILVERVAMRADGLVGAIRDLREKLAPDIELTPDQAEYIANSVGKVGSSTAALLIEDTERTAIREDAMAGGRGLGRLLWERWKHDA